MAEDEKKPEEGEECDPALEDCDSVKKQLRDCVHESDVLEMGIKNFETAKRALQTNKNIFDTEEDEKSFDDQMADFDVKINKAKELLKEQDDRLYDGMKKFNLCEKTEEPVPETPVESKKPASEETSETPA